MTLHWDGDIILFITDASGNVVDFKAGLDGEIAPRDPNHSALVTYERDIAGVTIGSTVNGTTTLAPLDAWDGTGPNFSRLNYAQYVRPDGFQIAGSDGGRIPGIQINGVRAFDPALGSWTTPDAYEGDIHDPASQQKYMWNRGNPVDYSDPSGYDPYVIYDPNRAFGNGHLMIAVMNPKTGLGHLYSQGPVAALPGGVPQKVGAEGLKSTITMHDLRQFVADHHDFVLTERTTAAQDDAMNKRAEALIASNHNYNVITCNCSQFVKDVLSAADPRAADGLTVQPRFDFINLALQGFRSGHQGQSPDGFTDPGFQR
jgi:RHS repeat-associated protein